MHRISEAEHFARRAFEARIQKIPSIRAGKLACVVTEWIEQRSRDVAPRCSAPLSFPVIGFHLVARNVCVNRADYYSTTVRYDASTLRSSI